jgi:hypothetical protein
MRNCELGRKKIKYIRYIMYIKYLRKWEFENN